VIPYNGDFGMRPVPVAAIALFVSIGSAFGQGFECYPAGPLPANPVQSCESAVWNGIGGASVTVAPSCGFPVLGTKFLSLTSAGPLTVPLGGPVARPAPAGVAEVRYPIPVGAAFVAFAWDFYNGECNVDAAHNDGMSVDVVDASGALILNLVYGDTASVEGVACIPGLDRCGGPISDIGPAAGPNPSILALPPLPACAYISIVVWDGGDALSPSFAKIDPIIFDVNGPACPVPCFGPPAPGGPSLTFTGPAAGCLLGWISGMPPTSSYVMAITVNPGTFPTGWFYGISIAVSDLITQVNFGFPFTGFIGAGACDSGTTTVGTFCGLPSSLTIYAVAIANPFPGPGSVSPPVAFTIP
jgi:hypothetical protein